MLYHNNAKPLYEQFIDLIIQKISSGEYKYGTRLPGERTLAQMNNVSRTTIRQAIDELVNQGVLYRQHGKGTFVAKPKIEPKLNTLLGVAEELENENVRIGIKLLRQGETKASYETRQVLKLKPDDNVYEVRRLITADDEPILVDNCYLQTTFGNILKNCDLKKDIIYPALETCGYRITHAWQKISASSANAEEAKLLKYYVNASVLVVKRITFVEGELPIMLSKSIYRGDKYEYKISLKRSRINL